MNRTVETQAPDALHVGFSKCASTFLQVFFDSHPRIFLVNQSHYFSPFEYSDYPAGRDCYLRLFEGAAPHQIRLESDEHILMPLFHPVLGAAATTLEAVREASRRIRSVQPAAKIVVVIRNQVDLIVSRYSEYMLCGGKCGLGEFVDEFLACSTDGVNYFQNYYAEIIRVIREDFSADNVLVLLQEELARDETGTIERLSEFLGVEAHRPERRGMLARRVGLSSFGIGVMRGINRVFVRVPRRSYVDVQARIPGVLYKALRLVVRWLDYYLPARFKADRASALPPAAVKRIREMFRQDTAALEKMLSKNLEALGY